MKPKILIMSDHSGLHTGFATVSRHIINHLYDTGKYEIIELGWFAPPPQILKEENKPRWQCYMTERPGFGNPENFELDKYGKITLPKVLAKHEPDVLLTIGDQWMVEHAGDHRNKWNYKWVCYVPIDGRPHPPQWSDTFRSVDTLVAYGKWGASIMRQRAPELQPKWIWHGCNIDNYKPMSDAEKLEGKKMLQSEGNFLIGCVARNQPRKQIPILFKAFAMFTKRRRICKETGKIWVVNKDEFYINDLFYAPVDAPFTREAYFDDSINPFTGKKLSPSDYIEEPAKEDVKLYLHMAFQDVGWDLMEQIGRYKLQNKVIYNKDLQIGVGVNDAILAKIYNAFDVFALPTIGEGWGLPISEAMSCGIPVCVTNYSAQTEWVGGGGILVDVKAMYTEIKTNIERALCDNLALTKAFDKMYSDPAYRKKCGEEGRKIALEMDWKTKICPQWEKVVDEALMAKTFNKFKPGELDITKGWVST